MAILSNDRVGPGYLAVELTVDKRLHPIGPLTRGPVVSWDMPDEAYELIKALLAFAQQLWHEAETAG